MSEKKLLPCPFCAGEARLQRRLRTYGYYVICKSCGCRTPLYQCQYDSREKRQKEAISSWNTRKPMERIVQRLEEKMVYAKTTIDKYFGIGELNGSLIKQGEVFGIEDAIEIVKEEGGLNDSGSM